MTALVEFFLVCSFTLFTLFTAVSSAWQSELGDQIYRENFIPVTVLIIFDFLFSNTFIYSYLFLQWLVVSHI
jgi:hypothetical protein